MNTYFEQINRILADWNPIGVNDEIALDEYKGYVPLVIRNIDSKHDLMKCLENILVVKMEVGYDPRNKEHLKDLQMICGKIFQAFQGAKVG